MSGFSFGGINVDATKKAMQADLIENTTLIDKTGGDHPYFLILLDEYYSPQRIKKIQTFMKLNGIFNYKAITALNVHITKDEIKGGLAKFYRTNSSDWKNHVEGARGIITVGSALYSVTQTTDLMVDHFRDVTFNKPYFYSPDFDKWVFPIDTFNEIFPTSTANAGDMYRPSKKTAPNSGPVNTFKTHYAEYVLEQAQKARLIPYRTPDPILHMIETTEEFVSLCEKLKGSKKFAWDLETSGLDFMKNRIGCITMSNDGVNGYYTPWEVVDKKALNELLESVEMQIGANLKFDVRFLWRNGIPAARIDNDTVQLGHVLNEQRYNGLKAHAFHYTRHGGYDRELDRYREKTGIDDYTAIPTPILFDYATLDAVLTWQVHEQLQKQLSSVDERFPNEKAIIAKELGLFGDDTVPDWTMRDYYEKVMMPSVRRFAKIEFEGVYVNKGILYQSREAVQTEIEQIEQELRALWSVPGDFDFNSPTKLGILFERLGWEDLGRTKAGHYQSGDEMLGRWAHAGHQGAKQMQRLRSLKTILKTFLSESDDSPKGWAQYLRLHEDDTIRMHPTFNVMRTESGRCRSDSPNMQNVPSHGDLATKVKKVISVPNPEEYYLSTVDYASLQIRLAAIDTNFNNSGRDDNLYNVYIDPKMGGDMHSRTGYGVFCTGRDFDLEIVEVDQDGRKFEFFGTELVNTERGKVYANDLKENDVIVI